MRTHPVLPPRLVRALLLASSLVVAAGCGGGSSSSGTGFVPNSNGQCDPGTAVQLDRPFPGQTGVSSGTNSIEIVANGNSNTLYNSFAMWDVLLLSNFSTITSSALQLAPADPSGQHPYSSDFYYTASIGGLNGGTTYNAYLNAFNTNCQPVFLGSFST